MMSVNVPAGTCHIDQAREHLTTALESHCGSRTYGNDTSEYGTAALRTAQVGTGHAVLALGQELASMRDQTASQQDALRQELAGVRHQLGDIAAAVRELTGAIAKTGESVTDAVDQLTEVTAAFGKTVDDGLAPIATAISSLSDAVEGPQRRSWRERGSWWRHREATASKPGRSETAESPTSDVRVIEARTEQSCTHDQTQDVRTDEAGRTEDVISEDVAA